MSSKNKFQTSLQRLDEATEQILNKLSVEEKNAYLKHKQTDSSNLSLSNSLRAFELFLNGVTCHEIVNLNEGFTLGAVVDARLRDKWDQKREAQLLELYKGVGDKVKQTHSEAMIFVADLLAVAHKKFGPKVRRFLQTGDENELEGVFKIDTIKAYKDLAELFIKTSGLSQIKKVEGEITHKIEKSEDPAIQAREAFYNIKNRPLTDEEQANALDILENIKK